MDKTVLYFFENLYFKRNLADNLSAKLKGIYQSDKYPL